MLSCASETRGFKVISLEEGVMQLTSANFAGTLTKHVQLPYWVAMPDARVSAPWPLLLFLHGSGERGTDLTRLTERGIPKELAAGRHLPFLVVAPQCPLDTIWSVHLDALMALIEHLQMHYPIDPTRIYVTGMSMGGTGTWHLAITYPHSFAAIAPICGDNVWYVGDPAQVCAIRHLPIWCFHGALDAVIPVTVSQTLVHALEKCGGNVRLTIYPEVGHNCWNQAYTTEALYTWLADQQRSEQN